MDGLVFGGCQTAAMSCGKRGEMGVFAIDLWSAMVGFRKPRLGLEDKALSLQLKSEFCNRVGSGNQ